MIDSLIAAKNLLQLDQVAFCARSTEHEFLIKKSLGLLGAQWIEDEVVATGYVNGISGETTNRAKLLFCYKYGIEIEILQYLEGKNYLDQEESFIESLKPCHFGFHVEKGKNLPEGTENKVFGRFDVAQQVVTQSHTNEFLIETGRRYRYTIYNSKHVFGTHLKVIERIMGENE